MPKKPTGAEEQSQTSQLKQSESVPARRENIPGVPISPPASTGHSDIGQYQEYQHEQQDDSSLLLGGSTWSVSNVGSVEESYTNVQENFWIDPGLLPQSLPAPTQQFTLPFDEVFQPDTASSFNMPYTVGMPLLW